MIFFGQTYSQMADFITAQCTAGWPSVHVYRLQPQQQLFVRLAACHLRDIPIAENILCETEKIRFVRYVIFKVPLYS